ncbi:MAG: hypothetical protein H6825_04850 [Planctomycetes bacterium]|nr:hypothetical protein [Planctomycetota bacterium]
MSDEAHHDRRPDEREDDSSEDDRVWVERSVRELLATWVRLGPRYARRLETERRARDPASDVLLLAARRLLPLRRPIQRVLPGGSLQAEARAQLRLVRADREVLWDWRRRESFGNAERLHLVAALGRLVRHAQAVRRELRAPPAGSDGPAHGPSG